jgi:hypothetical protein
LAGLAATCSLLSSSTLHAALSGGANARFSAGFFVGEAGARAG